MPTARQQKRRQIERSGFSARHRSEKPLPLGGEPFGATGPGPRTTPRKSVLMYDRVAWTDSPIIPPTDVINWSQRSVPMRQRPQVQTLLLERT
jgi:hypothetical protein